MTPALIDLSAAPVVSQTGAGRIMLTVFDDDEIVLSIGNEAVSFGAEDLRIVWAVLGGEMMRRGMR